MVLHSRPIAKTAAAAMAVAAAAAASANTQKPAAAKSVTPPRVLQSEIGRASCRERVFLLV